MRSKWKRIKKPKHYTKLRHFAAKTVDGKYGSNSEAIVAEAFIALLVAGLAAYGYKYGFLPLFVLCGLVSAICCLSIVIFIWQSIANYFYRKNQQ